MLQIATRWKLPQHPTVCIALQSQPVSHLNAKMLTPLWSGQFVSTYIQQTASVESTSHKNKLAEPSQVGHVCHREVNSCLDFAWWIYVAQKFDCRFIYSCSSMTSRTYATQYQLLYVASVSADFFCLFVFDLSFPISFLNWIQVRFKKCTLGLKSKLIRFLWSRVKGHSNIIIVL